MDNPLHTIVAYTPDGVFRRQKGRAFCQQKLACLRVEQAMEALAALPLHGAGYAEERAAYNLLADVHDIVAKHGRANEGVET